MPLPSQADLADLVRLHVAADALCEAVDEDYPIYEAFTHADEDRVAQIVRRELKSKSFSDSVQSELKGKAFEDKVLKLSKNVLTQLFKTLYTRRSVWRDNLSTLSEGRDDINKLAIPKAAKAYARRTSKSMDKQPEQFLAVNAKLTNPKRKSRAFSVIDDQKDTAGGKPQQGLSK